MSRNMERVVVTGIGVASPVGCNIRDFWTGLLEGRPGGVTLEDEAFSKLRIRIGALVSGYDERAYFDRKEARRMSRSSQFAVVAAHEAISQACLDQGSVDLLEVAVVIGSAIGGFSAADSSFRDFYLSNGRIGAMVIPISMNNGPSANVSLRHGFQGPLLTVDGACASAAHSIAYAYNLIRTGMLEVAVTGGADCPFSPTVMGAWAAMRALSERNECPGQACRPFSADRDGLVLGEGAGILVVESESHALRRGIPVLAEIKGYGATSDSHHLTQPSQFGPARSMRRALQDARLAPEQIDWINAHATGTEFNDRNETAAIKDTFGPLAYQIPVVGNKAALGHSIAASGALELIACILSIRDQVIPPTINYTIPDPECDLDYVVEGSRPLSVSNVMSNSFAFGGSNASLIVGEYIP